MRAKKRWCSVNDRTSRSFTNWKEKRSDNDNISLGTATKIAFYLRRTHLLFVNSWSVKKIATIRLGLNDLRKQSLVEQSAKHADGCVESIFFIKIFKTRCVLQKFF